MANLKKDMSPYIHNSVDLTILTAATVILSVILPSESSATDLVASLMIYVSNPFLAESSAVDPTQ